MNISNGSTTTYFVGSHYEVANGVVTKYYYAGSQRIALRTNGTLNYLLGDHLGSTSLTTDANGQILAEMRYKAWGEMRYASGSTPTKYQYTGQYSYVSDFGLHFYNARWYDSSLSRFASADTIVPFAQGVQGWDRYAYSNNNPIIYTDPSGHCIIICLGLAIAGGVYVGIKVSEWLGYLPDNAGIRVAEKYTNPTTDEMTTYVASGIAVQSQWQLPYDWNTRGFPGTDEYSGLGIAQISDKQMEATKGDSIFSYDEEGNKEYRGDGLGMPGQDQMNPDTAVEAMRVRITLVTNACNQCSVTDIFIAAALAQNGPGFTRSVMAGISNTTNPNNPYRNGTGPINWASYLEKTPYNKMQLRLFALDALQLQESGYHLPSGIDWNYINNLTQDATRWSLLKVK